MNRITKILVTAAVVVTGCSRLGVKGDGVIKTEARPVTDFSKIEASGAYEVQWSHGKPGVSITTDENILPHITTAVSGPTLKIDSDDNLLTTKSIVVIVSSESLTDLQVSGAVTVKARQIDGEELKLESTGATNITVEGAVGKLDANLTGASRLNARSLQAKTATLDLNGATNADVTVSDALKVSVTGAGSLTYGGSPKSVEKTVTGAGSVRPRP
jgi:hypothetical protein